MGSGVAFWEDRRVGLKFTVFVWEFYSLKHRGWSASAYKYRLSVYIVITEFTA